MSERSRPRRTEDLTARARIRHAALELFAERGVAGTPMRAVAARVKSLRSLAVPAVARVTLPALCDLEGVLEVPHLTYRREGADPDSVKVVSAMFRPRHVLAGAGFAGQPSADGNMAGDHVIADRRDDQKYKDRECAPSGDIRTGGE